MLPLTTNSPQSVPVSFPYRDARNANEVTQKSGSNFFSSFHSLTSEQKQGLQALYAFCRIADDCVDELPSLAEKQNALAFWREELERVYSSKPLHPVTRELQHSVIRHTIPKIELEGILDGCEMDLQKSRYATLEDLKKYCHLVAGLVGRVTLRILDYDDNDAESLATHLGLAFQLTNIIRDVGSDLKLNRIYLPKDLLEQFQVEEEDLLHKNSTKNFIALKSHLTELSQAEYQSGLNLIGKTNHRAIIAVLAMAKIYHAILTKIVRQGYPVLHQKVSLSFSEKLKSILPLIWKSLW